MKTEDIKTNSNAPKKIQPKNKKNWHGRQNFNKRHNTTNNKDLIGTIDKEQSNRRILRSNMNEITVH
jgi:hypothetical protein